MWGVFRGILAEEIFFFPNVMCFFPPQPGSSLEQTHIFVLAHILRRPIIVYGVKYYKSFRGETLGYTRFQGECLLLRRCCCFSQMSGVVQRV